MLKEANVWVGDNSDAIRAVCIHSNTLRNKYRRTSLGNFIRGTIKRRISRRKNIKRRVN